MTETNQDVALAAAAQQAGEAGYAAHLEFAEATVAAVSGSGEVVDRVPDVNVDGPTRPGSPSTEGVSLPSTSSPNITNPLDNSQSQP